MAVEVLTVDVKIAETLNLFFGNIVNTLNIEKDQIIFCDTRDENDPLLHAIKKIQKTFKHFKDKTIFQKSD